MPPAKTLRGSSKLAKHAEKCGEDHTWHGHWRRQSARDARRSGSRGEYHTGREQETTRLRRRRRLRPAQSSPPLFDEEERSCWPQTWHQVSQTSRLRRGTGDFSWKRRRSAFDDAARCFWGRQRARARWGCSRRFPRRWLKLFHDLYSYVSRSIFTLTNMRWPIYQSLINGMRKPQTIDVQTKRKLAD